MVMNPLLMGCGLYRVTLRAVIDTPRWLLLAALVYAPWAYGCTPAWTIRFLEILLAVITGLWLAGCALRRAKPRVHPVMLGCAALILIQGWWMAFNPHYMDLGNFRFTPLAPRVQW